MIFQKKIVKYILIIKFASEKIEFFMFSRDAWDIENLVFDINN